jgi:ketosteroid isomerase-like protein
MKQIVFIIFTAAVITACQPAKLSESELKEILHQQNEKLEAAFKSGDVEKLALMYSPEAKLSGDGEAEIHTGRDAIKKFWATAMEGSQLVDMETSTQSIDASGDVIYETGKVTSKVKYQDSVYTSTAKYVNVWKKQPDGSYLLEIDTWNRDQR